MISNDTALLFFMVLFVGIDVLLRLIDMRTDREIESAFLKGAQQTSELWVSLINTGIRLGYMTFPRGPEHAVSHIQKELQKRRARLGERS